MNTINKANEIIGEYLAQGYRLTLRQIYYQFVARDLIPNKVSEYKRLGSIINDGRLAGLIDWSAIEDRTRELSALPHWNSPASIIWSAAESFRLDKWATQPTRIEVWIEKEALAGVFKTVCQSLDVPFLSCRGYTSQSEMWRGARRLLEYIENGQSVVILHFGDHDPSGIDMTRDIRDRLRMFGVHLALRRIALNMDQIEEHGPPPNPAKETDSCFAGYIREYGESSWELDAMEPKLLSALVEGEVNKLLDRGAWEEADAQEKQGRALLHAASSRWHNLTDFLNEAPE